ncbi:MAG TPA: branched-chain amino acid ABC transporter permease, partial [Rubrivivax sp.]|nr:branched-chain amino acid ABC transporter permease [Rubrivivax sp.]
VLMVLALVMLSELTQAWLLYLGLVFVLMVMYAPGGIASLVMMNLRMAAHGKLPGLAVPYALLALAGLVLFAGSGAIIEMVYHRQLDAALGPATSFLGVPLDTSAASSWAGAAAVLAVGVVLFELARRRFAQRWGQAQTEIEQLIALRERQA